MFWKKAGKREGMRGEPLPERHDGSPDSYRPSGLCPRCEKQSSFDCTISLPLTFDGGMIAERDGNHSPTFNERATVLVCRHCKQGTVVLEDQWIGDHRSKENRGGGVVSWRGFYWWPLAGSSLHQAVPNSISSAFNEAVITLAANCPRASAAMARRTLEAIAVDQGETDGTLAQKLQQLTKKGLLHPSLAEWAREVRLVGNLGEHFDPIDSVSLEDARQLIDFIRELAKFIYVLPFELNERRQPPPPPPRNA